MGLINKELVITMLKRADNVDEVTKRIQGLSDIEEPTVIAFKLKSKDDLTKKEQILYGSMVDEGDKPACVFDCVLPKHEQKILMLQDDKVWITTFYNDEEYGCYIDEGNILSDGMFWSPLPKPIVETNI